jgi:AcrR family transcriptional regulator
VRVKSFDRREELLEAGLEEFASKSYEEASLNNIIKNAGISKGTFYYHFRDKQDLYLKLLQSLVDVKMEFLERRLKGYVHNEDLSIFENLKLQARFGVELAKEQPKYYLLGLMFRREKGSEIYEKAMSLFDDTSETYFDGMVEKAIIRGDFREGISASFAKKMITFLLYRANEFIDISGSEVDFDLTLRDFDELIDFMQYGLGKRD